MKSAAKYIMAEKFSLLTFSLKKEFWQGKRILRNKERGVITAMKSSPIKIPVTQDTRVLCSKVVGFRVSDSSSERCHS